MRLERDDNRGLWSLKVGPSVKVATEGRNGRQNLHHPHHPHLLLDAEPAHPVQSPARSRNCTAMRFSG